MPTDDLNLPDKLLKRLSRPLPGRKAQARFSPELSYGRHRGPIAFNARHAAILALIYPVGDGWSIPLTLRPDHLPSHASQVCFPGGMSESDETSEQTALRELEEELGVVADDIRLLGKLSPVYVFASNFWVTPVVGLTTEAPRFTPNPSEVAEIVVLSIDSLMDEASYGDHTIDRRSIRFRAPHIACGCHRIWGATSMMLGELVEVIRECE